MPFIDGTDTHIQSAYDETGKIMFYLYTNAGTPNYPSGSIDLEFRAALIKKNGLVSNPNLESMTIAELESEFKE